MGGMNARTLVWPPALDLSEGPHLFGRWGPNECKAPDRWSDPEISSTSLHLKVMGGRRGGAKTDLPAFIYYRPKTTPERGGVANTRFCPI